MSLDQPMTIECIACQGAASKIGEVPYAYHFLQHQLSKPLDSGDLYECSVCGLWFKYRFLPQEKLARFYIESPDTLSWDNGEKRSDFEAAVSEILKTLPEGGSVLDFGCYKGGFLRLLPQQFTRHGIEPSAAAAETASAHNIEVIGNDVTALGNRQFDCITVFDVFEHLIEPLKTLDALFDHIRPGGLLCVGTGFADFPAFHRSGAKYSYVCMPEHVCFLTERFIAFLHNRYRSGYKTLPILRIRPGMRARLRIAAINCINLPMLLLKSKKAIFRCYPTHRLRVITSRGLQASGSDHVFVVFWKPKSKFFPAKQEASLGD
jgi:SAM-dependent methyltransferase